MDKINIISKAIKTAGVLITIVRVEGSAYRKPGTMMCFAKDGKQFGMVSASCLESDLKIRAEQLLNHSEHFSEVVVYDMSHEDDLGWGRGAGCNGKVHILLEKVDRELKRNLEILLSYLNDKIPVRMNKSLQSVPNKILTTYYPQGYPSFGATPNNLSDKELYVQNFHPQQRLIIFGAGDDVIPLITVAQSVGFEVFVWDWRPDLLDLKRLRQATYFTDIEAMTFYPSDYVVVMTHDFQHDQKIIQQLLWHQTFQYVGVLGPKKRMQRLLNKKSVPSWIHNPVGLSIKAEGPEEIAISIIAEIIKVKNEEQQHAQKNHRYLSSSRKKYKI